MLAVASPARSPNQWDVTGRKKEMIYPSPMLRTNGCEPSAGHWDLSLKEDVSQTTSNISYGSLTGWVEGQAPLVSKVPDAEYEMWDEWSALSRLVPSQQLEDIYISIFETWIFGSYNLRWKSDSRTHATRPSFVWQADAVYCLVRARSRVVSSEVLGRIATEADSIPFCDASIRSLCTVPSEHPEARFERSDLRAVIWRSVIYCHTTSLSGVSSVGNLGNTLVCPVAGFEIHVCCPVVWEIFAKGAGGAICESGDVSWGDGWSERILVLVS
jgi:hypothetical protein